MRVRKRMRERKIEERDTGMHFKQKKKKIKKKKYVVTGTLVLTAKKRMKNSRGCKVSREK